MNTPDDTVNEIYHKKQLFNINFKPSSTYWKERVRVPKVKKTKKKVPVKPEDAFSEFNMPIGKEELSFANTGVNVFNNEIV